MLFTVNERVICLTTITKPPEVIVNKFLMSLCLLLSSCFLADYLAVKGKWLEPT